VGEVWEVFERERYLVGIEDVLGGLDAGSWAVPELGLGIFGADVEVETVVLVSGPQFFWNLLGLWSQYLGLFLPMTANASGSLKPAPT
jgi:hypothetical protein